VDRATHAHLGALLEAGRPFAIATVVAVHGSASAQPGSSALIDASGTNLFGWVGGGCAERFVCEQAVEAILAGRARMVTVDLDDEIFGIGMPCGGRMEVFIEPVPPTPALVVVGHDPVARAIAELSAEVGWRVRAHSPVSDAWPSAAAGVTHEAGLVGRASVAVVAAPWETLEVREGERVVVATRHAGDLPALRAALAAQPASIHLVASRSNSARTRAALLAEGADPAAAFAIEAPAGLDLGGRTAPEIALAVVAALEARRNGASAAPLQAARGAGLLGVLPAGWGPPELVIVGHSRICEALAALGVWLGLAVSVDGPPAGAMDRYPGARRVEPSADFSTLPASPATAVVVAAHHKGDHGAIAAALRRGAPYVGLVASAHRSGLVRSVIAQMGVPDADLARLRAPAGLDLGGRSPTSIALSVLAEALAARHGRGGGRLQDVDRASAGAP
jgi:xanthine dehydrogenase accessory factor